MTRAGEGTPAASPGSGQSRRGGRIRPAARANLGCHERECSRPPMVPGSRQRVAAGPSMSNGAGTRGTSLVPRRVVAPLRRRPPLDRRRLLLLMAGVLVVIGLVVAWLGQ